MRVLVAGQRSFGAAVAEMVEADHRFELVAVTAPYEHAGKPDRLRLWAERTGVPAYDRPTDALPEVDVIVAAHSHLFLGRRTRARARLAAVGYHPSLLPLHRGRDAVRWTVRDGDRVAGGSVYHLTDQVDGGALAAQDYVFVRPGATAASLWRDQLFPLGLRLLADALGDMHAGLVVAVPQDEACATWEPSWERAPLHRPELPELLPPGRTGATWTADPAALKQGARL